MVSTSAEPVETCPEATLVGGSTDRTDVSLVDLIRCLILGVCQMDGALAKDEEKVCKVIKCRCVLLASASAPEGLSNGRSGYRGGIIRHPYCVTLGGRRLIVYCWLLVQYLRTCMTSGMCMYVQADRSRRISAESGLLRIGSAW